MSTYIRDVSVQIPSSGNGFIAYVLCASQRHDLVKCLPAVVLPDRIPLLVADMIVSGDEDADGVLLYGPNQLQPRSTSAAILGEYLPVS
jgi:hypothetical protein